MVYHIYLHRYIVEAMEQFGPLWKVIPRIVDEGVAGAFPIEALPPAPHRTPGDMVQVTVDVTNEDYNAMVQERSTRSSLVSLRRIIYHFVDNELYVDLGWQPSPTATPAPSAYQRTLAIVITDVARLRQYAPPAALPHISHIVQELEVLQHAEHS